MNQSNRNQQKWIALSIMLLLIVGGVYFKRTHPSPQAPQSSQASAPNSTADANSVTDRPATDSTPHVAEATPDTSNPFVGLLGPIGPVGDNKTLGTNGVSLPNMAAVVPTTAVESGDKSSAAREVASTASVAASSGALATGISSVGAVGSVGSGTPGATSGSPVVGGNPSVSSTPVTEKPTEKEEEGCFLVTYKHKHLTSHTDEETCSRHKNLLTLKHTKINSKSVCVRVNGTPVHYLTVKGRSDELIIGALAGPKAQITVRYCLGKATCPTPQGVAAKDDCTVPKDEFMEAIGGTDSKGQNPLLGQWDPKAPSEKESDVLAKLDGEVKKELETNEELNGRAPAGEMFKDWIADAGTPACAARTALNQ